MPPSTKLKTRSPVALEQLYYDNGYILKWLNSEQFWKFGRYAFFNALREANNNNEKRH